MFDFKKSIEKGMLLAGQIQKNESEVNSVFVALNKDLHEQFDPSLSFKHQVDTLSAAVRKIMSKDDPNIPQPKQGFLNIVWTKDREYSKPVATWEQHPDGYPFTVQYLDERIDCWDQQSLVDAINKIVSSGQFWSQVEQLKAQSKPKLKPRAF